MEDNKPLEMDAHPSIEQPKKNKIRLSPPKWSKYVVIFALFVITIALIVRCTGDNEAANINTKALSPVDKQSLQTIGSNPTAEYRDGLNAYTEKKTQESVRSGSSFVPPVAPGSQLLTVEEPASGQGTTPAATVQRSGRTEPPAPRTVRQRTDTQIPSYLSSLESRLASQTSPQVVTVHNKPTPRVPPSPINETSRDQANEAPGLTPGDILYAINVVTLDSDSPGPAMARIVGREYKGSRVTGGFRRSTEHLTLEFDTLVTPQGRKYKIKAYAIDPTTDRTGIRSSIDTHFWERWGGLAASSFLQGLGQAISQSGTTSYQGAWGSTTTRPKFSLEDQLWIAGGKVGERAANVFERNFDRPPTVVFEAGKELGILIVSTEPSAPKPPSSQVPTQQRSIHQNPPSSGQLRQLRN